MSKSIALVGDAYLQYSETGVIDTALYMELANNGVDPEALIESFEQEKL